MDLHALFIAPLGEVFFQKALWGGAMVAVVSGVVGCLVVLRRMAFLGDALSHAMIAGVAGGYLVMKLVFGLEAHAPGMLLGSLFAAVATVGLIGFVSRVSRVKEDAAIGIMYTGIFALGVVAVSIFRNYIHIDLMHFIMGDILGVADQDLWASALTSALVLSVIILFYRQFQLASFDPVMAASIGIPVLLLDYALTTCVSLVVVSAVSMVGVILVVGLLITPAATAYLLSDRLAPMMFLAALFGLTSVTGGLYLCVWLDSAGGGAVMLFCTLQFLVVLALAPRYGLLARWWRLRHLVPQPLVEDILHGVLRGEGRPVPLVTLRPHLDHTQGLERAIANLTRQGLLKETPEGLLLSMAGEKEAVRLRRAHRLWETYLAQTGTAPEQVHEKAHHLEHVRAGGAMDYLDDLLGHPTTDPHGEPIPSRPLAPGEDAPLSWLPTGTQARVCGLSGAAVQLDLSPGDPVELIARETEPLRWRLRLADGAILELDHAQADGLRLKLDQITAAPHGSA